MTDKIVIRIELRQQPILRKGGRKINEGSYTVIDIVQCKVKTFIFIFEKDVLYDKR